VQLVDFLIKSISCTEWIIFKKILATCNYAGIYIFRYSTCQTHKTCCVLHELLLPVLFQAQSQCVQSFRVCLTKRRTEWDRRHPRSHIKHANYPKEALRPSQALKNWITCLLTASNKCITSCCVVIGSDNCHPRITWLSQIIYKITSHTESWTPKLCCNVITVYKF
jgi:hypothetical protein